jgi:hypothetical protein
MELRCISALVSRSAKPGTGSCSQAGLQRTWLHVSEELGFDNVAAMTFALFIRWRHQGPGRARLAWMSDGEHLERCESVRVRRKHLTGLVLRPDISNY